MPFRLEEGTRNAPPDNYTISSCYGVTNPEFESFYMCLNAYHFQPGPHECYTETIYQPVSIMSGQKYSFSFVGATRNAYEDTDTSIIYNEAAPIDFKIRLAGEVPSDLPGGLCGDYPIQSSNQIIMEEDEFSQYEWGDIFKCDFVANDNYANIVFTATNDEEGERSLLFFDNVKLWCESQREANIGFAQSSWNVFSFAGNTTGPDDVTVSEYKWSFGDGKTASGQNVTHEYAASGEYFVTLCITDNRGCTSSVTQRILMYNEAECTCPNNQIDLGVTNESTLVSQTPIGINSSYNNAGHCISIKGELVIDKSFELKNGEIIMHPGSSISIPGNSGFELKLTGSNNPSPSLNIHGCAGIMWKGIDANNNKITIRETIISDAENAILCTDGASVKSYYSIFQNNWIGLRLSGNLFLVGYIDTDIKGTSFLGKGSMNIPFTENLSAYMPVKPYAGIVATNLIYTNLKAVNGAFFAPFADLPNTYKDMENGILSQGSDVDVNHSDFINITKYPYNIYTPSGNGIFTAPLHGYSSNISGLTILGKKPCNFMNCTNGIQSYRSNLFVEKATFVDCQYGINATDPVNKYLYIKNCTMTKIANTGISVNSTYGVSGTTTSGTIAQNIISLDGSGTSLYKRAIHLNLNAKYSFYVEENHINTDNFSLGHGIFEENCSNINYVKNFIDIESPLFGGILSRNSNNNLYNCNSVRGISTSPSFKYWHNAYTFANNSTSVIECNGSDNTTYGLYFDGPNDLTNRIITNEMGTHYVGLCYKDAGSQTGAQYYTGNTWSNYNGPSVYQAFHGGGDAASQYSKYNVPNLPQFNPNPVYPDKDWFIASGQQTKYCEPACVESFVSPEFGRLDSLVTAQAFDEDGNYPAMQYILEKMVMYKVLENPELQVSPVAQVFYNTRIHTNAGKFARIKYMVEGAGMADTALWNAYADKYDEAQNLKLIIRQYEAFIADTSGNVTDSLIVLRKHYIDSLGILFNQVQNLEQNIDSLMEIRKTYAIAVLSSITPTNAWEMNDRLVWDALLNRMEGGLTPTLKDSITALAVSCWGYAGDAVYIARAMVDTFSVFFDTCPPPIIPRESKQMSDSSNFKLYPNPAHQSITIDGLTGEPCQIAIRSIFGYTLKKLSSEGTKQLEINIQDLPAGFYILDIMSSNNDSFTTKFIKQ